MSKSQSQTQTHTPIRTRYQTRQRSTLSCPEPTRTKQSFKDECDVNNILKKYLKTGQLPDMIKRDPKYGDFSSVASYQESINTVRHAHEQFEALPAAIRNRFNNDPSSFLAFASDPRSGAELIKMGLATPTPQPAQPAPKEPPKKPDA